MHPASTADAFRPESTHGIARREGMTLVQESTAFGWHSLYASVVRETPWSAELPQAQAPGIAVCLAHGCAVVSQVNRLRQQALLRPRQFSVLPPAVPSRWTIAGAPHILHLYLRPGLLESVVEPRAGRTPSAQLLPQLCVHDPVIEQAAELVLQLLREGADAPHLMVDQVALLLATRLATRHGVHGDRTAPRRRLMTGPAWQRVLDHIEAHLGDKLQLQTLAQVGGVHASHLWRAFQANLGTSPQRYVANQRLQRARRLLSEEHESIASIASGLGYSSQSHFSAAFRKAFALSPAQFRQGRH
jgi:AraC family transcriptional regulator